MLYIGSCRYMKGYPWAYFPARLHSTREIIFFLENIDNIRQIISESPRELTNFIFKYNINIHNIGKYIESMNKDGPFIEDYMSDSRHYSKGYGLVKAFLISRIIAV